MFTLTLYLLIGSNVQIVKSKEPMDRPSCEALMADWQRVGSGTKSFMHAECKPVRNRKSA